MVPSLRRTDGYHIVALNFQKWKCLFLFIWPLDLWCSNNGMTKRKCVYVCFPHPSDTNGEWKGIKNEAIFWLVFNSKRHIHNNKKHFFTWPKELISVHFILWYPHLCWSASTTFATCGTKHQEQMSSRFSYGSTLIYDRIEWKLSWVCVYKITGCTTELVWETKTIQFSSLMRNDETGKGRGSVCYALFEKQPSATTVIEPVNNAIRNSMFNVNAFIFYFNQLIMRTNAPVCFFVVVVVHFQHILLVVCWYTTPMNDECYKYWNANEIEWWNLYAVMFLMRSKQIVVMFGFSRSAFQPFIRIHLESNKNEKKKKQQHTRKQALTANTLIVKWKHINRFDFRFASEFLATHNFAIWRAIHKKKSK